LRPAARGSSGCGRSALSVDAGSPSAAPRSGRSPHPSSTA
jgi:hypothetical protein